MLNTCDLGTHVASAALAMLCASACSDSGAVEVTFLFPEAEELSPLGEQIAEVVLIRTAPGTPLQRTQREMAEIGRAIDMGFIEVGEDVRITAELRSPNQRLVGYGRSPRTTISPGDTLEIRMHLRKPFLYVTGDTSIAAFDATRDVGEPGLRRSITAFEQPAAAVASPDGAHLIVVARDGTTWSLFRLSTSDHASIQPESFALVAGAAELQASDVAVSDDGRFAVVGFTGDAGGVSVVDLTADPTSSESAAFTQLGNVTRVNIDGSAPAHARAHALIDGGRDCTDGPASTIASVALGESAPDQPPITATGPVSDVAMLPTGSLLAALPCRGEVVIFEPDVAPDTPSESLFAQISGVSAIAVTGDRVWSAGTLPAEVTEPGGENQGARLVLVSSDVAGDDRISVELPALQERARAPAFSDPGEETTRQIDADNIVAYDLAAVPGNDFVAVLTRGWFHASAQGIGPVFPELFVSNREYMLIDTATGAVVQRVRTLCELTAGPAVVGPWECTLAPGQLATESAYEPLGIAALYGAR
ncbi:MAG: hypothetical protein MJE77_46195 [Proteobacteria bacterium]|nr:hypothetical protein [Pseudomonadota bacterium]